MKAIARIGLLVLAVSLLAAASFAATNVIGKWKGRLAFDMRRLPQKLTPQEQAQIQDMKKLVFTITLRKDGSYTSTVRGGPVKTMQTEGGTWRQTGNKITVTPKGKDGKAVASNTQVLSLSKDGKSLAGQSVSGVNMVFAR